MMILKTERVKALDGSIRYRHYLRKHYAHGPRGPYNIECWGRWFIERADEKEIEDIFDLN